MGILDRFRKDEVIGTKVLVCAIGEQFAALVNEDAQVYGRHYPATTKAVFTTIGELMDAVPRGYDVIHLLCQVQSRGQITDATGTTITSTELIKNCCVSNVKLLWVASDNPADAYITGFDPRGKRLNLVMTLNRKGAKFTDALDKLLFKMSCGDAMSVAWNDLWPQIPGSPHPDAPDSISVANRGAVRLR